ncbi:hypothetical protein KAR91_35850 [Candidatus Pacearchaeota archaeon]|nr:hypothetical protein [Candidatus Pacearchaeota archaeon]
MTISQARKYLIKQYKPEWHHYIEVMLAGDFAVLLAEDHERLSVQLEAELKWRNDNDND